MSFHVDLRVMLTDCKHVTLLSLHVRESDRIMILIKTEFLISSDCVAASFC